MDVRVGQLRAWIQAILRKKYSDEFSKKIAEVIVYGEIIGRPTHGILRLLPNTFGPLNHAPIADPVIERSSDFMVTVHGKENPGMLVAQLGVEQAIELSQKKPMGLVVTNGTFSSSGSMSFYASKLIQQNLVCILCCNTNPILTTFDGVDPFFGTNPLSIGVPNRDQPIVLDFASTKMSYGEILKYKMQGRSLPEGIAVDAQGKSILDPAKVFEGALLPFDGGPKSSGLALMIECLATLFSGASFSGENKEKGWGHFMLYLNPQKLAPQSSWMQTVSDLVQHLQSHQNRQGEDLRIPGQKSLNKYWATTEDSIIQIQTETYEKVAKEHGLNLN